MAISVNAVKGLGGVSPNLTIRFDPDWDQTLISSFGSQYSNLGQITRKRLVAFF